MGRPGNVAFHFQIPATPEVVEFMRECMEDIWNTSTGEISGGALVWATLRLNMLDKWSVGWRKYEVSIGNDKTAANLRRGGIKPGNHWVKQYIDPKGFRVQCIVYEGHKAPVAGADDPPHVEFRWDVVE